MPLYREIGTEAPDYEPMPYYSSDTEGLLEYLTSAHEGQAESEDVAWLQSAGISEADVAGIDADVAELLGGTEAPEEPGESATGV